jgi:UDP-glucose 4-epimerase
MNILVTGGAGFIGSHIVDQLIASGHNVVILDNLSTGDLNNINPKATTFIGSITDESTLNQLFKYYHFDYVYHLAAQINLRKSITNPRNDAETNIVGSLSLIEKCNQYKIKKLVFSSTGGAIYSPNQDIPFNENSLVDPSSPYGLSKLTVEKYLQMNKKLHRLDYVALRYSNVYGPRQNPHGEAGVIAIFMNKLLKDEDITIYGDGLQTRDFVHVSDVVKANILAINLSGTYNVSTNVETNVNDIANQLITQINPNAKVSYASKIEGEMARCRLDASKLCKENWHPRYSFDIGLKNTILQIKKA